jgi:hypothetical protein
MGIPYIQFVISMLDAPSVSTDKKKKDEILKPTTQEEQLKVLQQLF